MLRGKAEDYQLGKISTGGKSDLGLYLKSSGEDELIATLKNSAGESISLESKAFEFV